MGAICATSLEPEHRLVPRGQRQQIRSADLNHSELLDRRALHGHGLGVCTGRAVVERVEGPALVTVLGSPKTCFADPDFTTIEYLPGRAPGTESLPLLSVTTLAKKVPFES